MDIMTDSVKIEGGVKDFVAELKAFSDVLISKADVVRKAKVEGISFSVRSLEGSVLALVGAAGEGNFTMAALDQISTICQKISEATDQAKKLDLLNATLAPGGLGPVPVMISKISEVQSLIGMAAMGYSGGPSSVGSDFKKYFIANRNVIDMAFSQALEALPK